MLVYQAPLQAIVAPLCAWYRENKKPLPWRESRDPYHIWLSEIMLQQTRIEAVIPYYHRFLTVLPTVQSLAECPDDLLMKLWEGLGYYSRVRNLKKAAIRICEEFGGKLPRTAEQLRRLPGIGDYTAGAIASIAFSEPEPAVDGNVLRVISRLCGSYDDIALPATKKTVSEELRAVYPIGEEAGEMTEGLMELGETVCIPNGQPKCEGCPLCSLCVAHRENLTDEIPVKSAKKARKDIAYTVLLLFCNGKIALRKRPAEGLLGGLWEFPNLEGHRTANEIMERAKKKGLTPSACQPCGEATHIFTHLNWNMVGYRVTCQTPSDDFVWVFPEELDHVYALPTAFRYYRKLATKDFK